jgi:signal transduction histidine kinase
MMAYASQQEGYLQIQSQAKRILSMCNRLLELHKHVSDEGSLDLELFDLSVLFQSLIEDMSETASAADVTLIPEIQPDIMFRGDETLMIRLLSNLMENGIKYRREDVQSFVRVRLYKKDRAVYLEVSDNGIGIRKEDYESIFNRFYKVEKSRNFLSNSFGLGLALVKWITQAHGGTIHVESTFGQATTFRCVFPDAGSTQLTIPSQG